MMLLAQTLLSPALRNLFAISGFAKYALGCRDAPIPNAPARRHRPIPSLASGRMIFTVNRARFSACRRASSVCVVEGRVEAHGA